MRAGRRGCRKGVSGESSQALQATLGGRGAAEAEADAVSEWGEETKGSLILTLRKFFLFEQLPQERILQLVGKLQPRAVERGEVVIREGEAGDALFLV